MFLKSALALTVSAFLLAGCTSDKPKALKDISAVDFAHEASDLPVDPDVVYGKLSNGLRYAVMHNDTPTKTAALRVRIATGSLNETDEQRGLAHFLEHMAFNGSKNIPEGEMIKRLERHGLAFGADTNAYTSFDQTVYTLDLPETSDALFDETLMIMRETVENLTLAQDAIDRERGIVQAEKRRGDSPEARAGRENLRFLTQGSRIYERLPIGDDATLANMAAADFRQYYEAYYRPENTFVVLVGDVETDYAVAKITEHFSSWQAASGEAGQQQDTGLIPARGRDIGYFSDPDVQTTITLTTIKPYIESADTAQHRKQSFIDGLGNRILNRRLSSLARKADAQFIGGGGGVSNVFKAAEFASLSMSSRPENWEKALFVGVGELRKALEYGFSDAELKEQIANSLKGAQVAVQTAETRRTGGLAGGILSSFAGEGVFTHPGPGLDRLESFIDDITVDEVWDSFKQQWSDIDTPLLYLKTSEVLENPDEQISAAFAAAMKQTVTKNAQQKEDIFAYTDFGTPGKVVETRRIDDVDADLIRFENNVLLNLKKTDFEKDTIRIAVSIGDGSLSIPSKDGALSSLASNMMSAGGFEAHSADDFQRLMAGKAVRLSFGIGTKAFSISGATVSTDLADQLNVMAALVVAPGYREEAQARYIKYIESWYPTLDSTPGGVASRDVGRLLRSGDPRYGLPSQAELLATKIEDVKNWISPQLKSGQIEISVVGDFDKADVIAQIARTFGALPKRDLGHKLYPEMTTLTFPKGRKKPVILSHSGDDNRAQLRVHWPAPDGSNVQRNRKLSVLRSVFANKLIDVIREEEAAAYSPSAGRVGSRLFEGYGYMSATLGLEPKDIADMTLKLAEIAEDLRAGNISDDEFERVIQPILENLDTSLESNSYWMRVIGTAQTDTWAVDNFRTRDEAYRNMTLADIKPLAAGIFRADLAYTIQILPDK